jgi:cell division protein FtsL
MAEKKTQTEELLEKISKTEELLEKISRNLEDTNKGIETNKESAGYTKDSKMSEPKVNETKPSETKSKKMVRRSVAVALGIICIVLIAGFGGAMLHTVTLLNDKNNQIDSLNTQISSKDSQISQLNTQISTLNSTISSLNSQISQLNATLLNLLNQSEPYIHSQLLGYPPTNITANSRVEDWILNWTPTTDIRIIRIQVWMGNPDNVVWEGDTFVTIGKPSDPWNSSSYTDALQLLVHYQFDSHAPSPIPHQLMFDLTPGFKVASGQTVNVYRLFVNTELYTVYAGDVQVIIYYENT